jgi:hypothetical protein
MASFSSVLLNLVSVVFMKCLERDWQPWQAKQGFQALLFSMQLSHEPPTAEVQFAHLYHSNCRQLVGGLPVSGQIAKRMRC